MAVMSTAVERLIVLRPVRKRCAFDHWQCIHIGAQTDGDTALAAHNADHAGAADAGMDLDAPGPQQFGDARAVMVSWKPISGRR